MIFAPNSRARRRKVVILVIIIEIEGVLTKAVRKDFLRCKPLIFLPQDFHTFNQMHRAYSFHGKPPVPYQRSNSVYSMKIRPSELLSRNRSPCEKDRFCCTQRLTPTKKFMNSKENSSDFNKTMPFPESPYKSPNSTPRKKQNIRIFEQLLDAPDVVCEFPSKLISFSKKNVLAVAIDRTIWLWDDGNVLEFMESNSPITGLCWADEGLVLTAGGNVELWDVNHQSPVQSFPSHTKRCGALNWKGHRLATGGCDNNIFISDPRTGSSDILNGHLDEISTLEWSPDGVHLASGSKDKRVIVWGDQKKRIYHHEDGIQAITWQTQNLVASCDASSSGQIWINSLLPDEEEKVIDTGAPLSDLCHSDKLGICASHRKTDFHWEIWGNDNSKINSSTGHTNDIINIIITDDNDMVATIGADETLRLWEIREGNKQQHALSKHTPHKIPLGITIR